jgi:hypothetical protein
MEGQLEHFIDFKNTLLDAPLISFVSKGKVHRVVLTCRHLLRFYSSQELKT